MQNKMKQMLNMLQKFAKKPLQTWKSMQKIAAPALQQYDNAKTIW